MTVKELIEMLETVENKNRIVICMKDAEGNGYTPLSDIDDQFAYRAEATWYGEVGYEKLTDELKKLGYSEEDIIEDGEPCLVLCPLN